MGLKQLRKWLLYSAGMAIIILMLWDLFFSKHGYFVFKAEQRAAQQLIDEIEALKAEKARLQQEVIRLREDPKALETIIHEELGYVYPDETMVIMSRPQEKNEVK